MNWEDILRHEYGHVLALSMTNKRVPFWFTEGLSVFLEHFPRDLSWDANLVGHYLDRNLVPLDSLTIAFTRPRDHSQRLLAYHESSLIIRDLVERKGWDSIPALLLAFGEGKSLDTALREVVGESEEELKTRAMEVIREEAASLAVWPSPSRARLARLERVREDRADDTSFLEFLALSQHQMQLLQEANATAKEILALDEENPRAHGILGLGYLQGERKEDARPHLEKAIGLGSRDVPVYVGLANLAVARSDTAMAIEYYGTALDLYPRGHNVRLTQARLLAASGDREGAVREYESLISLSAAAGIGAIELARMEIEDGRAEEAERTLKYALGVLPLDAEVVALRGRAFLLLDRDAEAYELFLTARRFDLKNVESMVGMAEYYFKRRDYEEAAYFAELALKYQPDHPTALDVLAQARAQ
jgi:tetratricopeptide (TPR) repeat protein